MTDPKVHSALHALYVQLTDQIRQAAEVAEDLAKKEAEQVAESPPPGMSDHAMRKLRDEHGTKRAYQIAWDEYNKTLMKNEGKPKRCTQATLEALGIHGQCPKYGTGVIDAIKGAGHRLELIHNKFDYGTPTKTVRNFIKENPSGSYYLHTEDHAMALVDGQLTDTAERGADGRRLIMAFRVHPKQEGVMKNDSELEGEELAKKDKGPPKNKKPSKNPLPRHSKHPKVAAPPTPPPGWSQRDIDQLKGKFGANKAYEVAWETHRKGGKPPSLTHDKNTAVKKPNTFTKLLNKDESELEKGIMGGMEGGGPPQPKAPTAPKKPKLPKVPALKSAKPGKSAKPPTMGKAEEKENEMSKNDLEKALPPPTDFAGNKIGGGHVHSEQHEHGTYHVNHVKIAETGTDHHAVTYQPAGGGPRVGIGNPKSPPKDLAAAKATIAAHSAKMSSTGPALGKAEDGGDKYNYYLVHKTTGKIHGGNEYKEDAHEAAADHPENVKVMHRSKVSAEAKQEFHNANDNMGKLHKAEDDGSGAIKPDYTASEGHATYHVQHVGKSGSGKDKYVVHYSTKGDSKKKYVAHTSDVDQTIRDHSKFFSRNCPTCKRPPHGKDAGPHEDMEKSENSCPSCYCDCNGWGLQKSESGDLVACPKCSK